MRISVTGGTGFVGRNRHATSAPERERVRGAREPVTERASGSRIGASRSFQGDVTDPASWPRQVRGVTQVDISARSSQGRPQESRVMALGDREPRRCGEKAGCSGFVCERTRTSTPRRRPVPVIRRQAGHGGDGGRVGDRAHDLSSELHLRHRGGALRTFMRQVMKSRRSGRLIGPGQRSARRPIGRGCRGDYFAKRSASRSGERVFLRAGGPDHGTRTGLYHHDSRTLGKRRKLLHVPFAIAREGATPRSGSPARAETDRWRCSRWENVVSNTDAVDPFGCPSFRSRNRSAARA